MMDACSAGSAGASGGVGSHGAGPSCGAGADDGLHFFVAYIRPGANTLPVHARPRGHWSGSCCRMIPAKP